MPSRAPTPARSRVGIALHASLAAAGLALLAGHSGSFWLERPELLAALIAVAVVCELAETWLASGIRLNATLAVAVMALALAGPITAFAVLLLPDLAVWALRREEKLLRPGTLANLAAYPWAALAGAAVLTLADVQGSELTAIPALITAGLVLAVANFAVGPALYAPLQLGVPLSRMPGELARALPAVLVLVLAGAATTALVPLIGIAALAGFALATLVPASALTAAIRVRPVADLDILAATRLYAAALGDVLGLDRRDQQVLERAAALCDAVPDPYDRLLLSIPWPGQPHDAENFAVATTAAYAAEWWDGTAGPAQVGGEMIPELSRVLAVAQSWAQLTAAGTAQLPHEQALLDLHVRVDSAYDPAIVAAAGHIIERDTRFAPHPAAQPRIHAWPGSTALRNRLAPRLLPLAA